jgi:hypothetical protein
MWADIISLFKYTTLPVFDYLLFNLKDKFPDPVPSRTRIHPNSYGFIGQGDKFLGRADPGLELLIFAF